MKLILSISLHLLLLLVFTTTPTTYVWACGGKDKCVKETTEHKAKCQKACCKKPHSDSKKNKKGCCGDNCDCAFSIIVIADLTTQSPLSIFTNLYSIFIEKRAFTYKSMVVQSSIQDIWQPPITCLS